MSTRFYRATTVSALALLVTTNCMASVTLGQESSAFSRRVELQLAELESFDLSVGLDTLTSQLGAVTKDSSTRLSGTIIAELDLRRIGSEIEVLGIRLVGGEVLQDELAATYTKKIGKSEIGPIDFSTSAVATKIYTKESMDAAIETIEVRSDGDFDVSVVRLLQDSGKATVDVPKGVAAEHDFQEQHVFSSLPDLPPQLGSVTAQLESIHEQEMTFSVTLELPMQGQQLVYQDTGLPVTLEYLSGALAATGTFTIPEPSTLLLLASTALVGLKRSGVPRLR